MKKTQPLLVTFQHLKSKHKLPNYFLLVGSPKKIQEIVPPLAKMLGCAKNNNCNNSCFHCQGIDHKNYDVFFSVATSDNSLTKQELSPLLAWSRNVQNNVGYQVFHLAEIEKLTLAAGNSLLKFLETFQSHCFGILTTSNLQFVLPTVQSRLQVFYLGSDLESHSPVVSSLDQKDQLVLQSLNQNYHDFSQQFIKKIYLPTKQKVDQFFTLLAKKQLLDFYLLEESQIKNNQFWFFLEVLIIHLKLFLTNSLFIEQKDVFAKSEVDLSALLQTCLQVFNNNQKFYQITKNHLNEKNAFLFWMSQIELV